jgi:hypothetical protein
MGLDKHENEVLIRTGVSTDVWFHVDDVSSAHVYLRLPSVEPALTIDDIPEETMEDMCQLVKNNSISGCKMNSADIVYCFHSNLKKELVGMDVGTVGFHDRKKCHYRKVVKDKAVIKRMEASKKLVEWDYDKIKAEWVEKERVRLKAISKANYESSRPGGGGGSGGGDGMTMFDAIKDANMTAEERILARQAAKGENRSGLDVALDELDGITFAALPANEKSGVAGGDGGDDDCASTSKVEWKIDEEARRNEENATAKWLRERGYTSADISAVTTTTTTTKEDMLKALFFGCGVSAYDIPADAQDLRAEEKEVLGAIFGDEPFSAPDFKFTLPVTGYEPLAAFEVDVEENPLVLELSGEDTSYPYGPPVLAILGGGLPERALRAITRDVATWLVEEYKERGGGDPTPIVFEIVTMVQEKAEEWCAEWKKIDAARKMEEQKNKEERERKAREERVAKMKNEKEADDAEKKKGEMTKDERRADAMNRLGGFVGGSGGGDGSDAADKTEKYDKRAVSNKDLINDLFN